MAVVDQHALAAHLHGVRWATLATSVMELTHPLAVLPAVAAQVVGTHSPPPAELRPRPIAWRALSG